MTGLEPHPILRLPSAEEARRIGPERCQQWLNERARRMVLEQTDPLRFGFKPEIWNVVDDLLVDGNTVVLDLTRIATLCPDGRAPEDLIDVPIEIRAAAEVRIGGSKRSSKSEYAGRKCIEVECARNAARGWSFADTGPISIARQQPIFWRYLPIEVKRMARDSGKAKAGVTLNVSYKQKTGFAEGSFVLGNASQHWFKNYEQDVENMEGDQLDIVWFDELRNPVLLKNIRYRMGDRGGIIIATFTSFDENYAAIDSEYDTGAKTVLEVPAELLPLKDKDGEPTGKFEKVPRIRVAGPGSEGNQRANTVYFHITDNPYYGVTANPKPGEKMLTGKERFYRLLRGATRERILANAYGILLRSNRNKFPEFNEAVHVIDPDQVETTGSNYHVADPCDGRNWAMLWARLLPRVVVLPNGKELHPWRIYREWPSYSPTNYQNTSPSAYIPGIGDPGPWALPGEPADGVRGPAQNPFGFGLTRIAQEILRCEGHPEQRDAAAGSSATAAENKKSDEPWWKGKRRAGLPHSPDVRNRYEPSDESEVEEIVDRYIDSRYSAGPTLTKEAQTTLRDQMSEVGLEFLAASGKEIMEGVELIHELLDYDQDVRIGQWSPRLGRINEPLLKISRNCPNVIYALKTWTNLDKGHGAVKDFIDLLRYLALADVDYIGSDALISTAGGARY